MTPINRKLKRETSAQRFSGGKQKSIVIELSPPGTVIGFRLKGERTLFTLAISTAFGMAVQSTVAARKAARKQLSRSKYRP